jgi:hypothetical protein
MVDSDPRHPGGPGRRPGATVTAPGAGCDNPVTQWFRKLFFEHAMLRVLLGLRFRNDFGVWTCQSCQNNLKAAAAALKFQLAKLRFKFHWQVTE